jgi:hypothetical protein
MPGGGKKFYSLKKETGEYSYPLLIPPGRGNRKPEHKRRFYSPLKELCKFQWFFSPLWGETPRSDRGGSMILKNILWGEMSRSDNGGFVPLRNYRLMFRTFPSSAEIFTEPKVRRPCIPVFSDAVTFSSMSSI